jgi:hypothetical protein
MKIYSAISAVAKAMSGPGVAKGRKNVQQGYQFRGIDDVMNALSSALPESGMVILPRVMERTEVERQTKSGGALFYVTLRVEFDLVAVEDGSRHTVVTYGEAMDSADKATNKAMSAAYKYLALLTFCIPTEATPDTDADFTTHEVAAVKSAKSVTGLNEKSGTTIDPVQVILNDLASGNAAISAKAMSRLSEARLDEIWKRLPPEAQEALMEAWPK